ncbi:HutP family protein [Oscillospiraceae bacterium OttesenSCG-928-G22]|nr:HutP family protein [Oscillospiraceae bacterium OttesenSCG-928-G22]
MAIGSKEVAAAVCRLAVTPTREEENEYRKILLKRDIQSAAVNFGGEFISSIGKAIEHAVVAARREGVIAGSHPEEGAVAGAAREALSQMMTKAVGLNVGGKIAVCRSGEHISVCMFFGIGLLNLDEIAIGLGHRVI